MFAAHKSGQSAVVAAADTDPNFSSVPLLLKTSASATRSTVVADSSASPITITRSGTVSTGWTGPYQTDGYWSLGFGSASSTYGYINTQSNTAFQLTTSNFTIEFWAYTTDRLPSQGTFCRTDTGGSSFNGMLLGTSDGTNFLWYATSDGGSWNIINGGVICTIASVRNRWAHFAFVRSGSTFTAYVDGVQTYTTTSSASIYQAGNGFRIGTANNANDTTNFAGFISNFRYVKGIAVYSGTSTSVANFTVPTSPLGATQNARTNIAAITGTETQLLTCQSNRIKNNANNTLIISNAPGTVGVPFDWYPSGFTPPVASLGAAYFNGGTPDYLINSSTTAGTFGSNNFTVEAWVYPTAALTATLNTVVTTLSGSVGDGWQLYFTSSGTGIRSNLANYTQSSTTVTPFTWNHIVWCRNGSTYYLYLNGVQIATSAAGAQTWDQTYLALGETVFASNNILTGYIANVRLVKGLAVYAAGTTGNQIFTPPSGPLTQTGGTYPSTTNITNPTQAQTTLLLNFADSNYISATDAVTNNTFIDTGPYAWLITRSGTATQGSFTPYWPNGYWSNYFIPASQIGNTSTSVGAFGSNNFTVECWFYAATAPTASVVYLINTLNGPSSNGWQLYYTSGGWGVRSHTTNFLSGATTPPVANTWNHVAWTRNNSTGTPTYYLYVNGVRVNNNDISMGTWNDTAIYINNASGNSYTGYISNVRLVNGVAVYAAGNKGVQVFTPPSLGPLQTSGAASAASYPSTTNVNTTFSSASTTLLTCQNNRFKDNSAGNIAFTITSTPSIQPISPFPTPASYSPAEYGGSIYNPVKTDGITATSVAPLTTFTGNFTIECWVYPTDINFGGTWGILDTRTSGSTPAAWIWGLNGYSSGWTPQFYNSSGSVTTFSTRVQAFTWTHVVLQRNGSTVRCFINGVLDATTGTVSGTITGGSSTVSINNTKDSGIAGYGNLGYTSNLRIVNGTAVYAITGFTPPTAPVTAIANTSLLLNYTNSGIYDASAENNLVTYGTTQASTAVTKFSPTSIKFNGTTDYLAAPVIPAYSFGTGDFTVEGWFYFNAFNTLSGNDNWLISLGTGYNGGGPYHSWALRYNGSAYGNAVLEFVRYDGTTYSSQFSLPTANNLVTNTWYHIACSRRGTSLRMYLNGVPLGTLTSSTNFNQIASNTDPLQIGKFVTGAGTFYHNGYVQDIRISKAYARYVTSFAVPTAALTPTATTAFLLKSDYATDGTRNNTFLDSSSNNFSITRVGTPTQGSVTPYWPTGYWSNYFTATSSLSNSSVTTMNFSTSTNFTIEAWLNWPTAASSNETYFELSNGSRMILGRTTSGLRAYWNGTERGAAYTFSLNTWYHIAIVRNSGTVSFYINGTLLTSFTDSVNWTGITRFNIGVNYDSAEPMTGYVSNLRVVNGTAVYTSAFIPPTIPLTAIANTQLLTCQSNRFKDNSTNNFTITRSGTPRVQTFQPFNPTASYTPALYAGSAYLPGGTSYISTTMTTGLGSNNFTIEFWGQNLTTGTGFFSIGGTSGTDFAGITMSGDGGLYISTTGTNWTYSGIGGLVLGPSAVDGQWHHYAIVRNGANLVTYRDGVQVQSNAITGTITNKTGFCSVGAKTDGLTSGIVGYVANFRLVNGTAVYTGAFTPPTLAPLTTAGSTSAASYSSTTNVNTTFASSSTGLLLNFANAAIYDATAQNNLISVSTVQASTTITPKFGTTSIKFNGTSDYLNFVSNPAVNFSTTDNFTVEAWVYVTGPFTDMFILSGTGGGGFFGFTGNTIGIGRAGTAWDYTATHGMNLNTWYHVAITRYAGLVRAYVNGIQVGTTSSANTFAYNFGSPSTYVGSQGAVYYFSGYMQDVRVTREVAPVFTPPTTTFLTR